MTKNERHLAIKQIILSRKVRTQEELVAALKKKKLDVTQATLSRDLAELGVSRVHTNAGFHYALPPNVSGDVLRNMVGAEIMSVTANETLVVVRTLIGHAHGVGVYLDGLNSADILGTIAGDDTVLVVPASHKKTAAIVKMIEETLV